LLPQPFAHQLIERTSPFPMELPGDINWLIKYRSLMAAATITTKIK